MSLKRDRSGNMILRFRTSGRGSRLEYRNLGPITGDEAKERAAGLQADAKRRRGLGDPSTRFSDFAKT